MKFSSRRSAIGDGRGVDTRKNLDTAAAEALGGFGKIMNLVSMGKLARSRGEKLYNSYEEREKLVEECDVNLKAVARVLHGTLTPEVNAAIQKHMLDGTPLTENDPSNVRSLKDLKDIENEFTPANIKSVFQQRLQQALQAEKQRLGGRRRGGSLDDYEQAMVEDRVREEVSTEYADKVKNYKGSGLLQLFLNLFFAPSGRAPLDKAAIRKML